MIQSRNKYFIILIAVIALFTTSYYLSSNRILKEEIDTSQKLVFDEKQVQQESSLKQKLEDDFEQAFIKQYTPLVGCEDLFADNIAPKCEQHLEQAKDHFKEKFIKERGLPKNTFEELKLSLAD